MAFKRPPPKPPELRLPEISEKDQARFYAQVALPNEQGCMLWLGGIRPDGYVQFRLAGKMRKAHRVAYTLASGPIPEGLHVDHVRANGCTNKHCMARGHLEAVTQAENNRRKDALKTHCPQGHPYAGDNLYIEPKGSRHCRICVRAAGARWRQGRAAA